ncbi:acyltransferase [Spirosoma taeanense]|uniref:Acyltransferase n=1 Tax=Spirosoma taeanense TaxID=2735870 RepID=A0A6M5YF28_9BACT|nr:acyltransferase [Spirosoma taeanense]QJW91891.1 acyltransferase [Spirosoma taeanense]
MVSIVYEHSLAMPSVINDSVPENPFDIFTPGQAQAMLLLVQPLKFGTICFFTISGFLLGKNLKAGQSPWRYYKRRLIVVGIPFLVAFGLFYAKSVGFGFFKGTFTIGSEMVAALATKLWMVLFFTTYWFIANFLAALGILLLFWRYTRSAWFGWVTGAVSLVYAINIHFVWFEPRHTFAVPAFVFYLWLGVYIARTPNLIERLQRLPSLWTTAALLITLLMALAESHYLHKSGSIEPTNSLRLTNQLFSLAIFVWLLGHNFLKYLPFLDPRNESFGVYLYHLFVVSALNKASLALPSMKVLNFQPVFSGLELVGVSLLRFLIIYSITLLFVKIVNRTRFKWLFGNR